MGRHRVLTPFGSYWKMLGATATGPAHLQQGHPNQDAYQLIKGKGYVLAVVCDGMGSAPRGKEGAEAAVQSVSEAVRIWTAAEAQDIQRLLKLIHQIWNIKVEQWGGRASATTCLFAMLRDDGTGLLARLGDGLIIAQTSGSGIRKLFEQKQGFANETAALGTVKDLNQWQISQFESFQKGDCLMLCTDGISEDINPDKEVEFMQFMRLKYGRWPNWGAQRSLIKDLYNWPTDKHSDDKTICLIWK